MICSRALGAVDGASSAHGFKSFMLVVEMLYSADRDGGTNVLFVFVCVAVTFVIVSNNETDRQHTSPIPGDLPVKSRLTPWKNRP